MAKRFTAILAGLLIAGAMLPAVASAETSCEPTEIYAASESLTSGHATVSGVELGATSATITVDVEGTSEAVAVDYEDLGSEEGPLGDYGSWVVLGIAGSAVVRFLGFLTRLV